VTSSLIIVVLVYLAVAWQATVIADDSCNNPSLPVWLLICNDIIIMQYVLTSTVWLSGVVVKVLDL